MPHQKYYLVQVICGILVCLLVRFGCCKKKTINDIVFCVLAFEHQNYTPIELRCQIPTQAARTIKLSCHATRQFRCKRMLAKFAHHCSSRVGRVFGKLERKYVGFGIARSRGSISEFMILRVSLLVCLCTESYNLSACECSDIAEL